MTPKVSYPRSVRRTAERIAAPPTQTKAKRLSPADALGWLHLMPNSAFPIRSREDMAAKISALLFSHGVSEPKGTGHGLPAGAQQRPREMKGAR